MVFICVICSVKTPPLLSLSDEHRQLLDAIVAPFINMIEFRAYQLQICETCKLWIEGVHKFQITALRGIQAFKSLLNELERRPPIVQAAFFRPILEAKPEPITSKTDPEKDLSTIKQEFISVSEPNDENPLSQEIELKFDPESKTEPDYGSNVTRSADGIPNLISHPDPDTFMARSGSVGSTGSNLARLQSMINNVIPFIQSNPSVSSIVCPVYTKKPESISTQNKEKTVISENSVKPLQPAKFPQLAVNRLTGISKPIDLQQKVSSKWQGAENSAKMASDGGSFEVFTHETRKTPELISEDSELNVRKVSKAYIRKKPENVSCPHCDKVFKGNDSLKGHIKRIHLELTPSPCETCGKLYRNEDALNWHIKTQHAQPKKTTTIDDMNPEWFCAECAVQFTSRGNFKLHMMTLKHTPREQYTFECETCKKKFPTDRRRQEHINHVHLKKREFKCEICSKVYCRPGQVREHIRIAHEKQAKPRRHVCHLCGKSFTISKSLQEHLLAHQGLRPFECKLCPATFSYRAALFTHNRLKHLKEKCKKKAENNASEVKKEAGRLKRKRRKVKKGEVVVNKMGEVDKEAGEFEKRRKVEKEARDGGKEASGLEKESEKVQKELDVAGQTADSLDIDIYFNKIM